MKKNNGKDPFVFSTVGEVCPCCGRPKADCSCLSPVELTPSATVLRIRRETKGRKGAGVTLIEGLGMAELPNIAALLKKKCGTGGAIKDGVLELQGDMREAAERELAKLGFKTKRCGA